MSERGSSPESDAIDQAMNLVLEAERDARLAVERCRVESQAILAAAQERARAVSRRAESRVQTAHRIADKAVAASLRELSAGEASAGTPQTRDRNDRSIDRALDALVDEILGGP